LNGKLSRLADMLARRENLPAAHVEEINVVSLH